MIFLAALWHCQIMHDRTGQWEHITGPAFVSRMEYDPQMKMWEILLEGGWVPLRDGDVIEQSATGTLSIKGL